MTTLHFSAKPGPRERHLQRKNNNPLFANPLAITQHTVQMARQQDLVALQQFMEQFRELVQRAVSLDVNVESDVILLLKAQLEQQYAVCTGLAGQPAAIQEALKKLIATINSTLRATSRDDPHALEKLDKDDEHTALHLLLCDHLIVSDILNPDGIISNDEQIATLLNESDDALQAALALFPPERISEMVEEAKILLEKIEDEGRILPLAWQRVAQMENWLLGE